MHGYFLRDTQLGREEGPQQQQGYLGCNLDKTGWIQCNYILFVAESCKSFNLCFETAWRRG